jgi:hypothetical protein
MACLLYVAAGGISAAGISTYTPYALATATQWLIAPCKSSIKAMSLDQGCIVTAAGLAAIAYTCGAVHV